MNKQLKKCFLFFVYALAAMENQSPFDSLPNDVCRLILTKTFTPDTFRNSALVDIATVMNAQLQETSKEIPNILTTICNERLGIISSPLFLVNKQFYRVLKQMTKQQYLEIHKKAILNQYPDFNNYSLPEMLKQVHSKFILNNHIEIVTAKEGRSVAILFNFYKNEKYFAIRISENVNDKEPGKLIHDLAKEIQNKSNQLSYHLESNETKEMAVYIFQDTREKPTFAICESWLLFLVECEKLSLGAKNKDLNPLSLWIDKTFFNVQSTIQKWYNDFSTNI